MPVCPRCRAEFETGADRCLSCNTLLLDVVRGNMVAVEPVEDEPPRRSAEDFEGGPEKLLMLLEEPLPEMAAMIREFLMNCGIDCVVHSESIGLLYRLPAPGAPISRNRLYVRESDYHEARDLVANFFKKT